MRDEGTHVVGAGFDLCVEFALVLVPEGRVAHEQDVQDHAARPDVHRLPIRFLPQHLRRQVARRAREPCASFTCTSICALTSTYTVVSKLQKGQRKAREEAEKRRRKRGEKGGEREASVPYQQGCSPFTSIASPKSASFTAAPLAFEASSRFSGYT